jgi:hypothetical protein
MFNDIKDNIFLMNKKIGNLKKDRETILKQEVLEPRNIVLNKIFTI